MSKSQATRITWLGHATVLIQTAQGTNILIDPFIAHNPKYPKDFVLPAKIDYVLLTHGHGDHISDAAPVAKKHDSTVVAIYELADYIAGQGVTKTMGMNLGGSAVLNDVTVTMVDAKHSAGAADEKGTHYVGVATGFVLTVAAATGALPRGRYLRLWRHGADTRALSAARRDAADRRLLHHGPEGSRGRLPAARARDGFADSLGNISAADGTPAQLAALVGAGVKVVDWKPGDEISV